MTTALRAVTGSSAENLFISLFEDTADKEIERISSPIPSNASRICR